MRSSEILYKYTAMQSYPLLSSEVWTLDCPHGHRVTSAMPESWPLELTEVIDVSCPFLYMGSVAMNLL